MKKLRPILFLSLLVLASCSGMPKLFWGTDEGTGRPDYAKGDKMPLDVPPILNEATGSDTSMMPEGYSQAVAGKAVAVNVRQYDVEAPLLFAAAERALLARSVAVTSSDIGSGTVISDWIKQIAESQGILDSIMMNSGPQATRHRYVLRIFRLQDGQQASRLEVRTLNQEYLEQRWVNSRNHVSDGSELFDEVERQLALLQRDPASR